MRRVESLLVLIVVAACGTAASGKMAFSYVLLEDSHQASLRKSAPTAKPNRPESVPDGYVVTPFGYFHSSCVQSLAEGEKLLANKRVQHANGTVAGNAAVCKYPHYSRDGKLVNGTASKGAARTNGSASTTSPEVNGWLENANVAT